MNPQPLPDPFTEELNHARDVERNATWQRQKTELTTQAIVTLLAYHHLTGRDGASAQGVTYTFTYTHKHERWRRTETVLRDPTQPHDLVLVAGEAQKSSHVQFTHPVQRRIQVNTKADLARIHDLGRLTPRLAGRAHADISYGPTIRLDAQAYRELRSTARHAAPYALPTLLASPALAGTIAATDAHSAMLIPVIVFAVSIFAAWMADESTHTYREAFIRQTLHLHAPNDFAAVKATPRPELLLLSVLLSTATAAGVLFSTLPPALLIAALFLTPTLAWLHLRHLPVQAAVRSVTRTTGVPTPASLTPERRVPGPPLLTQLSSLALRPVAISAVLWSGYSVITHQSVAGPLLLVVLTAILGGISIFSRPDPHTPASPLNPHERPDVRLLRERAEHARAELSAGQPYTEQRHRMIHAYETEWPASQAAVAALPEREQPAALERHLTLLLTLPDPDPAPSAHAAQLRHLQALQASPPERT